MEVRRSKSRMGLVFLLAVFSLGSAPAKRPSVPSPPYVLEQLENSDYRSWTDSELRNRIGPDVQFLDQFVCDSIKEFKIFTPHIRSNPQANSLRVRAQRDADAFVYRNGHWYTESGVRVKLGKSPFLQQTAAALAAMETGPTSRRLLRELEIAPEVLFIEPGASSFAATIPGRRTYTGIRRSQAIQAFVTRRFPDYADFPLDAIGSGGILFFNSTKEQLSVEEDGVARPTPAHVILAHEMYHAYDGIRGLLDRRMVWSQEIQPAEVTEIRASYVENLIRREAGHRYKKYYGGQLNPSGPGLLDRTGAPILIPAPCLTFQ